MEFRVAYPNELYHHGIKGQKWGVRRFQNKDGSLTPAGKERYSKANQPKEKGVGLIAAYYTACLAFVFGQAVASAIHNSAAKKNAEKFVKKCDEERNAAPVDKKSGLKLKTTNLDEKEDIRRVNPQYKVDRLSPGESTGATSNCVNCTMALEMRKRGFEVQAKLNDTGRSGMEVSKSYFPGAKTTSINKPPKFNKDDQDAFISFYNREEKLANRGKNAAVADATIAAIKQQPAGSRGHLCVRWSRYSGHSMMWEVTSDGSLKILDGQIAKTFNEKESRKLLMNTCATEFQRLDNLKCDYKKVKGGVK